MNSGKLSRRLESVAAFIPAGTVLADIGSDHAYLPVFCVKDGSVTAAVAGEVAEGPYHSAQKQVEKAGLTEKISVRKGDGLEILAPGEAGCITIAGMGGALIASILDRGKAKLNGKETLILQPNTGSHIVRGWLAENGWAITGEDILEEDGKIDGWRKTDGPSQEKTFSRKTGKYTKLSRQSTRAAVSRSRKRNA